MRFVRQLLYVEIQEKLFNFCSTYFFVKSLKWLRLSSMWQSRNVALVGNLSYNAMKHT